MRSQHDWPPGPIGGSGSASLPGELRPEASRNLVFQSLADERRRRVLRLLLDRSSPLAETTIASILAAIETETTADGDAEVEDGAADRVRLSLRNVHLPALEDAHLVEWDRDEGVVELTDHPALEDEAIRDAVQTDADVDDVFDALASERRRLVLAVLHVYGGFVESETVAEKVAELEDDGGDPEEVQISLHHSHFPKLDDAGLVRWLEDDRVRFVDHPDLEERWFRF